MATITVDSIDKSKIIIDGQETNLDILNLAVNIVGNQIDTKQQELTERQTWQQTLKDQIAEAIANGAITPLEQSVINSKLQEE